MTKTILPIVNPETGEILKEDSPIKDLSEARKVIAMKANELKQQLVEIDEILLPVLEGHLENDETKLCGYWSIIRGKTSFNKDAFKKNALESTQKRYADLKAEIKKIEDDDMYKVTGKPSLRFPKVS